MNKKRLFIILGLVALLLIIFVFAKKPKTPSPAPAAAIPSYRPFYSSLPKTVTAPSPARLDQTKKVTVYSFSPNHRGC